MDVRVLSFHAGYRCANAGACCTSSWPIPIEVDRHERVRAAIASGALRVVWPDSAPFVERSAGEDDAPTLLAVTHEHCVFHDPAGRCAIHAALGHDALPLACRQFPRVSVIDPRGVSVTLSHYCPTAAGLITGGPVRHSSPIVLNAAAFPATGEYVGLDARTTLPPLVRPGMLMDWESWWEVERLSVDVLLSSGGTSGEALARVRDAVIRLHDWKPGHGALIAAVRDAFRRGVVAPAVSATDWIAIALDAIPASNRGSAQWSRQVVTTDQAARRFLAAHAFANWTIHLGNGLLAWLRSIETAHAFLTAGAGVRHADLVLRHLLEPKTFAQKLNRVPF